MSEDRLLNDLAILGLPAKRKAMVNTEKGSFEVEIDIVGIDLNKKEINKLIKEFNKEVRVIEFIFGTTYSFLKKSKQKYNSIYVASSSLDELWEMFKADRTNQTIPERKCYMLDYYM